MSNNITVQIALRLPQELDRKLRILAAVNDRNRHAMIVEILRQATEHIKIN